MVGHGLQTLFDMHQTQGECAFLAGALGLIEELLGL